MWLAWSLDKLASQNRSHLVLSFPSVYQFVQWPTQTAGHALQITLKKHHLKPSAVHILRAGRLLLKAQWNLIGSSVTTIVRCVWLITGPCSTQKSGIKKNTATSDLQRIQDSVVNGLLPPERRTA
jgi:hypothetical protein